MTEKLIIKHRYVLTSAGNIRLRYIMASVALCLTVLWGGVLGASTPSKSVTYDMASASPQDLNNHYSPASGGDYASYNIEQAGNGIQPFLSRIGSRPYFDRASVWTKTIQVKKGDTLGSLIENTGLTGDDYMAGMKAIKQFVDPRNIRPGQKIEVKYIRMGQENTMEEIAYVFDKLTSVKLSQNDDNKWVAKKYTRPLEVRTYATETKINNSLFADLGKAGVPEGIINKLIQTYSWNVDFQRDIWGGETVELLYETKETEDGSYVRSNRLIFAKLVLRDKELPIYLFKKKDGLENYFEPDGQSIRRALMRTPVDGARLSSGYGTRKHPVLGYAKMHKGIDFAAPTGTPIYAAGDGVVERANRFSSFGNYIKIRHNSTYETAYAHLNGFAKGIRAGKHVKQGQVIGYIGTTGRSTGPHLHYEVHKNGSQVNPHSVKLPLGEKLRGTDMANFKKLLNSVQDQYASLVKDSPKLAGINASVSEE